VWSITSTWMRVESRSRSKKSPYRNFKNNTLAQSNFTLPSSLQILPTKRCCFRLHNSKDRGWRRVRTCWKPEMAEHPGAATNALCSSHRVRHRDKWKSMQWVCVTIHDRSVAYILSISFAVGSTVLWSAEIEILENYWVNTEYYYWESVVRWRLHDVGPRRWFWWSHSFCRPAWRNTWQEKNRRSVCDKKNYVSIL